MPLAYKKSNVTEIALLQILLQMLLYLEMLVIFVYATI